MLDMLVCHESLGCLKLLKLYLRDPESLQLHPSGQVAVVAMAKLLAHPNKALRQAVVHAMSVAEVEVAATPKADSAEDFSCGRCLTSFGCRNQMNY